MDETPLPVDDELPHRQAPETRAERAERLRVLRGSVYRWELIPFVVAIVLLFAGGLWSVNRFYDTRAADLSAFARENRGLIERLEEAVDQLCGVGERDRAAVHAVLDGLLLDFDVQNHHRESLRVLLERTLPVHQPCGSDQSPPTTPGRLDPLP